MEMKISMTKKLKKGERPNNQTKQIIKSIDIKKISEKIKKIKKISEIEVIILLFIFSLGLRLMYMNPGLFEGDSVGVASAVEETFKTGILHGIFNGRYGSVIVNLITYTPYHLITGIESAEKSILFTEILFASFSVIILFLFILKIFNNKSIALVAALLFSISPIFLSVTTYGNAIGIEIFFILTSFYLLSSFHKNNSQLHLALSSFSIAFSVMVRESALIFVPFYFLLYVNPIIKINRDFISLDREVLKIKNLISVFFPFLLTFGIYTYYVFYQILYKTLFVPDDGSGSIVSFMGIFSPILHISIKDLSFNLTIIGAVFVIGGIIIFIDSFENKFYFIFFLLWAGLFFYFGNTNTYSPYYLAIVSIPFYLFISIYLNALYNINRPIGIICLLFLIFILFSQIQPILDYRHKFSGEKEFALWVKSEIPPNSAVIVMNDAAFFGYYANLKTLSHPIGDPERTKTWVKEINLLLKNDTNIYIVDSAFSYDPGLIFMNALYQNFDIESVGSHIIEDYHKATIMDNRYTSFLMKVNRVITPEELLNENIVYKTHFTNKGNRVFFEFTNTDKTPLKNTKLKIEKMRNGNYFFNVEPLGDINSGQTTEIEITPNYPNPTKIMIWNEDLKSWMIIYRGHII